MKNTVYYPILRQYMGKYGCSIQDIANVISKSYRQTHQKLNRKKSPKGKVLRFDVEEARCIVKYFNGKGENVTIEEIFFNQQVSNETKTA